jgi:hypothetical protein
MTNAQFVERLRRERDLPADPVHAAYDTLVKECERLERAAKDAAFPDAEYPEHPEYLRTQVLDGAHAIIDYAHDLIHALKARGVQ